MNGILKTSKYKPFLYTQLLRRFLSMASSKWAESAVLTVKKSKFKGYCIPVHERADVDRLIADLVENTDKSLRKASHPLMCAWRLARPAGETKGKQKPKMVVTDQGYNDNGEGGAGLRLQGLLDRTALVNVLIVVARWYGGTPLGPARFRCISDVARESLENAGFKGNPGSEYIDFTTAVNSKPFDSSPMTKKQKKRKS